MTRKIYFLIVIAAVFLLAAFKLLATASGKCGDNITWTVDEGVLTLEGTGEMYNYTYSSPSPWQKLSPTKAVIKDGVTTIGDYAFWYSKGLTSVDIPSSVTSIGDEAFEGCTGMTSVTIPNSVTSIGYCAFLDCKLTSITIPSSVTSIGIGAFSGHTGLESIIVDPENRVYDSRDNCNAIIETETNTLIAGYKNSKIPNSVTSIGYYAFYGGGGLTSVTIPNSVTSIGDGAFHDCQDLTSVDIPNSVTSIEDEAFNGCTKLTSVTIPGSVTSIGEQAFWGCTGLTNVTIPNSVTSIGRLAFYNCAKLTRVDFPNSVTSIGKEAFYGCKGLTSVTIPNSITKIEEGTFQQCKRLTSVTIPNSVTSIGEKAFYKCTGLMNIESLAATPPACESYVFSGVDKKKCTLSVPEKSIDAYKVAKGWKDFLQIISGIGGVAQDNNAGVSAKNGEITVTGVADNAVVEVYSTGGALVYRGTSKTVSVPSAGIYIVKAAGRTFKVKVTR